MKIVLISPPVGCLSHPNLSLPSLTGFLRSLGHSVVQCDAGLRAIDLMFTPQYLRKSQRIIEDRLNRRLDSGKRKINVGQLKAAAFLAPEIVNTIDEAKNILRSRESFYQIEKYLFAVNTIHNAFKIVSAAFAPTRLVFNDVDFKRILTLDNIRSISGDEKINPFIGIIRDDILPELLNDSPLIVGISTLYYSQLAAAYTIARLVKSMSPDTFVAMGGAAVTSSEPRIRRDSRVFEWVDAYAFGEGEGALEKLVEIVASDFNIENDLNKLFLKNEPRKSKPASYAFLNKSERDNFKELPAPDYSGLNLEDFLAPENVFQISNSRGCYWGKCAFCNVSLAFKSEFQQRSLNKLRDDVAALQKKHNARFFYFADDCIPLRRCEEISEFAAELDAPFLWQCEIRFEKGFSREVLDKMYRGGCKLLIVGNESANQRILNLMRKNTEVETNRRIIIDAAESGIAVNLQNIIGFPGETNREAKDTIDFLVSLKNYISTTVLSIFLLTEFSPAHQNPEMFGVKKIRSRSKDEFLRHYYFSTKSGAGWNEVRRTYQEAWNQLNPAYPWQTSLLDGNYGAHILLFIAHFGERKLENIFHRTARPVIKDILDRAVKLNENIKREIINRNQLLLYNPRNGIFLNFPKFQSDLIGIMTTSKSIKEACVKYFQRRRDKDEKLVLGNVIYFGFHLAHELYQKGFFDLKES